MHIRHTEGGALAWSGLSQPKRRCEPLSACLTASSYLHTDSHHAHHREIPYVSDKGTDHLLSGPPVCLSPVCPGLSGGKAAGAAMPYVHTSLPPACYVHSVHTLSMPHPLCTTVPGWCHLAATAAAPHSLLVELLCDVHEGRLHVRARRLTQQHHDMIGDTQDYLTL